MAADPTPERQRAVPSPWPEIDALTQCLVEIRFGLSALTLNAKSDDVHQELLVVMQSRVDAALAVVRENRLLRGQPEIFSSNPRDREAG
jgi:hypothetical protein